MDNLFESLLDRPRTMIRSRHIESSDAWPALARRSPTLAKLLDAEPRWPKHLAELDSAGTGSLYVVIYGGDLSSPPPYLAVQRAAGDRASLEYSGVMAAVSPAFCRRHIAIVELIAGEHDPSVPTLFVPEQLGCDLVVMTSAGVQWVLAQPATSVPTSVPLHF